MAACAPESELSAGGSPAGDDSQEPQGPIIPNFKLEGGSLFVSYDDGVSWINLGSVQGSNGNNGQDGEPGEDGQDGVTPFLKLEEGVLFVSYDNGATWSSLGNVQGKPGEDGRPGADGKPGADGEDGRDGEDGVTPTFKLENGVLFVSYDNGLNWSALGSLQDDTNQGGDDNQGGSGDDGDDDGGIDFPEIDF